MKRAIFILTLGLCLLLSDGAHAQRALPAMRGLEIRGGMADGFYTRDSRSETGYWFGLAMSRYAKNADKWVFGAEFLNRYYPYKSERIPVAQFTAEGGYYYKFLADPSRTFFFYLGGSALAGYESVNRGERRLYDGSTLRHRDRFLYGGAVLAVVMLGAIAWSQWSFGLLLAALLVVGMTEFYSLAGEQGSNPQRIVGLAAGLVLFALNFAFVSDDIQILGSARQAFACGMALLLLLLPAMFICELYRRRENPAANIGITFMGVVYVALPFSLMCYIPIIGSETWSPWMMIFYVFIIWANDVFAYLVGMSVGRHRLCERLSPKKSWEGFFGGIAGAVVLGLVAARVMDGSCWVWAGLALVAAATGVLGDLVESMFKRAAGVKDSGTLIPGHGGVLDRFDAMLLSAPFVFVYMLFVM